LDLIADLKIIIHTADKTTGEGQKK
jgi:hypothetical protein